MGAALLLVYAVWRVTLGASLLDDGHVVGLALRMSRGAAPFADEMNFQVLGSLWAVPMAWAWTHVVGIAGLVLASRLYFVGVAFAVGYVCYRALKPSFGPVLSALGVAVPLLAPPYNILSVSYNTSALLALVLSTSAAFAALRDDSRGWALASGIAAAMAAISYPPLSLGGLALAGAFVALTKGRRRLVAAFLGGGALVAAPFAAWMAFGIGPAPIAETVRFSRDIAAARSQPSDVRPEASAAYTLAVFAVLAVPAIALVALATLRRFSPRTHATALAAIPLAAAVPAAVRLAQGGDYTFFGVLGSAYLLIVLAWMLVPVALWLRGDSPVCAQARRLFVLAAPVAVVGIPVVAITTTSRTFWGMPIVAAAPLVTATVIGWGRLIAEDEPRVLPWAAGGLIGVLVVLLTLTPFQNPLPWKATALIRSGAFAGVRALPGRAAQIEALSRAGARWVPHDGKVLFLGTPGGYLVADGTIDTNVQWLEDWAAASRSTVRWLDRRGGAPDTVFIAGEYATKAGGFENLARKDPLVAYVLRGYRKVGRAGGMIVFVRKR